MVHIEVDKSVKCNGEWSLYVTFPYNMAIVNIMRSFPSRFYNKDKKEWEIPFNKLAELKSKLADGKFKFDIHGEELAIKKKKELVIPDGFEFKTKPFQHQIEAFNYGLINDRWLLGDEQGLGKTKEVIDIAVAKKLEKNYKHCLIICGVNGLKWNWVNEVHTHSNEDAWILGQRVKNNKIVVGGNADKLADLNALDSISSYFLITNVESLRNKEIVSKIAKYALTKTIGLVATDESHKIKNPSSQQGKGLLKIQPECRIAMTGTPLMNTPLDLFIILKWLGYEIHPFYLFKQHYCIFGGFGGYEIIGYRYLDELQEQLNAIMLRRLKSDVLDLPEKTYVDEYVEMTPKQKQIYDEVTAEIRMNIDQIRLSPNPLANLIRMRQATGYTGILSSKVKESAKLDRMEELVEEAVSNGKKVVIFSNWTQITDVAYDRLLAKGFVGKLITGDTKDEERQLIVDAFQNSKYEDFIIGTIGAMGTGLTLTSGTVEIFLDEPWNRANKEQAEDRCHRVGTKENVTIYTLLCKDTIDERVHDLVYQKGMMADALVDGRVDLSKTDLLNFLIS